jgi:glycosyltransferase involved in cell wall biosynthesis
MKAKKISILISDISKVGGTERAAINLANMLVDTYNIEIVSFHNQQDVIKTFYDLDSRVKLISFKLYLKSSIKNTLNNTTHLKKYLKESKVDLLIGTWYGVNIILPFFKTKDIKVLGCEHADFGVVPKIVKKIAKITYPKLDAVVVLSDVAKKKLLSYTAKTVVIPNSLPFKTTEKSSLIYNRILMLGRLVPVKAYERVIPLGRFLQERYPQWKIEIFGDGELKDFLLNKLKENNITNIVLHQATKEIKKEYLNSSIYLSTSLTEAMPMVFLEAMSCGVPVISYKNEGATCLINDNEDGLLVENEEELIDSVKMIIENSKLREYLGNNGITKAKLYSEESIKKQWLTFFSTLYAKK